MVTSQKVDEAPFVSFTFRYRPLGNVSCHIYIVHHAYRTEAVLMAQGIVPRPLYSSYNNSNIGTGIVPWTVSYSETATTEIQRLEVTS